jgi:membrane protein YqaA with SNARE-associated domain
MHQKYSITAKFRAEMINFRYFREVGEELGYLGLFGGTFLSATIIPFASEAFVIAMLLGGYDPWMVVIIASIGNWAGGMTNYIIGYVLDYHVLEKRFRISTARLEKFRTWSQHYGIWLAFITWVPILGDPLTIALGFFRLTWWKVALLSFAGKALRYVVLAYITLGVSSSF